MLFAQLVAVWLEMVASVAMKESGYKSCESVCRLHLVPAFGKMSVEAVETTDVEAYVSAKLAEGLSARTVNNHIHVMRRLMRFAVDRGIVGNNPVTTIARPRQEPAATRLRYLTPEQLRLLIESTHPSWRILIAMGALTGLRKGEILALTWPDIDFDRDTISVSKTIKHGRVTSPKVAWAIGQVPMPASLVPLLQERRGRVTDSNGLVFCRRDGRPLPDSLPNRILAQAIMTAGLPNVTWHEATRHSWVVCHLQAGTDVPTLMRLGRWKTPSVLLATYAHVLPAAGGDAVRNLDELISNKQE